MPLPVNSASAVSAPLTLPAASTPISAPVAPPTAPDSGAGSFGLRTADFGLRTYLLLAVLTLFLGLSRYLSGPWFHVYHPWETSLLEGKPLAWEAVYYTDLFPAFTSDLPTRFGIAPVHYRTLLPLYLVAALSTWTGSAYWSFAAVDLFFWFLAGVATLHLARRLGATPWAALLGALLLVASPLLISHMWRHDLHPANFASMPLCLWAAVALVDDHRRPLLLPLALSAVLVFASLSYQYQWVLAPLILILCATNPRLGLLRGVAVTLGAVALYVLATAVLNDLFRRAVGPPTEWSYVASQPGTMIATRVLAVRSLSGLLELLPSPYHQLELVRSYHPALLVAGLIGVLRLGLRTTLLALAGLAISLFSLTYYSAPWAATNAYPLVYIGAGVSCATLGGFVTRRLTRLPQERARLGAGASLLLAVLLALAPNADLFGRHDFLLTWWGYFAARYLF
jgi:hypothetical protein